SAFDAYSLLVEAGDKRLFYSGDLRAHGRKAVLFENLVKHPLASIDVLMLEGTTLNRRESAEEPETERELEQRVLGIVKGASRLVLTAFSPQNIDRFVTIFRATQRAGRRFIADAYLAHLLKQLALPSLPRPDRGDLRIYVPYAQKRRIVSDRTFDLVAPYRPFRIYDDEIAASPRKWVMMFRASMMRDIFRLPPHVVSTLVYSLWPGYPDRDDGQLRSWCRQRGIALEIAHT